MIQFFLCFCINRCLDSQHVIPWKTCSKAGFWHVESPTCLTTHQTRTACAVRNKWARNSAGGGRIFTSIPSTKNRVCEEKHENNYLNHWFFGSLNVLWVAVGKFKCSVFLRPFPGTHTHQRCYFGVNLWPPFLPQAYSFIATAVQDQSLARLLPGWHADNNPAFPKKRSSTFGAYIPYGIWMWNSQDLLPFKYSTVAPKKFLV